MSIYHTSFTYKEKNSLNEGYIIVAFEPDNGFKDTFLSMENISDEYYDGTKRFNYGSKYSSANEIQVTMIKKDGTNISLNEFRSCAKWLTGARSDSWLDMYIGDELTYSFLGKFLNIEQYKYDASTIGIRLTFSSISPWAFSAPQTLTCSVSQLLYVDSSGVLNKVENDSVFGYDDGVLYVNHTDINSYFDIMNSGTVYLENSYKTKFDNQSDDLYTYIYLNVKFNNINSTYFLIKNLSLNEETLITGMSANEQIFISENQFIVSDLPHKIFGDDFNFIWPRLKSGINDFVIDGDCKGDVELTYRYPMKIGDCTMDIDMYNNAVIC